MTTEGGATSFELESVWLGSRARAHRRDSVDDGADRLAVRLSVRVHSVDGSKRRHGGQRKGGEGVVVGRVPSGTTNSKLVDVLAHPPSVTCAKPSSKTKLG